MTGLLGTKGHARRSALAAPRRCHDEGPDLPQGSSRRFSLSWALQAAIIGQLAPPPSRPPVRGWRAPPWCADTPPHAGPRPPPALRSASPTARSRRPARRSLWQDVLTRESPAVCASRSTPLASFPAGVVGRIIQRPSPPPAWTLFTLSRSRRAWPGVPQEGSAAIDPSWDAPALCSLPPPTYRAAGWRAAVAGAGRPVHLLPRGSAVPADGGTRRRARREVRPELGGLASAPPGGRLHLLSESVSHLCGRLSCRGGGSTLGAIIWEDSVPCPVGAVVSPLKKLAPHCSRPRGSGLLAPLGREGAADLAATPRLSGPEEGSGSRWEGAREGATG